MSETEKYMPFWGEFLLWLLSTLAMLTYLICILTRELLLLILTFALFVPLAPGLIWCMIKEYKSRVGKKGFLGYFLLATSILLLLASNSMIEWIWVELCFVLLGGGLVLYDIASKRNLRNVEPDE